MFGYFAASCRFMASIQAFWFAAVAAAESTATLPLLPICAAIQSTSAAPIRSEEAGSTATVRDFVSVMSASEVTMQIFRAIAFFRAGVMAFWSAAEMTIAL